jgi:hypothetical protein
MDVAKSWKFGTAQQLVAKVKMGQLPVNFIKNEPRWEGSSWIFSGKK